MHEMIGDSMSHMKSGPLDFTWVTYAWVSILSVWGGIANYIAKLRRGDSRFNLLEIFGEMIVSGFAGMMTFYICSAAHSPEVVTAVAVGISGHMGARVITQIEIWVSEKFGFIRHDHNAITERTVVVVQDKPTVEGPGPEDYGPRPSSVAHLTEDTCYADDGTQLRH